MLSVNFNKNKEIRMAYNKFKRDGIFFNGIIFGGMVRDEIVATYNKALFDEFIKTDKELYKKFWDTSFHPETKNRCKIPNDMDIYFQNKVDSDKFMKTVEEFCKVYGGELIIVDKLNSNALFYSVGTYCIHKKIIIVLHLGKTLSFNGHKISINIDLIINNDVHYHYEPPFNSADFSCNLFVMVKDPQGYNIRLSKNTGTPLDTLDYVNKKRIEAKIIDELLLGRIEFIRNVESKNTEYINGFRIMKMLSKDEYKITNLLFRDFEKSKIDEKEEGNRCDICMCDINMSENERLVEILTNKFHKNIMHRSCFVKYLENEILRKYINIETGEIECRCSRRNPFNFKNSHKFSILYSA